MDATPQAIFNLNSSQRQLLLQPQKLIIPNNNKIQPNKTESQRQKDNAARRLKAQEKKQNKSESQRLKDNADKALKSKLKHQSKTESQRQTDNAARRLKAQEKKQNKSESQRLKDNADKALKSKLKHQSKTESQRQKDNAARRLKAQQKKQNKSESQRLKDNADNALKAKQYRLNKINKNQNINKSTSKRVKQILDRAKKSKQKQQRKTDSQRQHDNAARRQKAQQKKLTKTESQRQKDNAARRLKAQQKKQNKSESQRLKDNADKALKAKQYRRNKINKNQNINISESQKLKEKTDKALKAKQNRQNKLNKARNIEFNSQEILLLEFSNIKQQYDANMNTWPSTPCELCDRMMYPIGLKRIVLQAQHIETLTSYNIDSYLLDLTVFLCHTCHDYLKKKKISSQCKYNVMVVPPSPSCISALTNMEIRLISQVKLHLQIFKLCNYSGQFGMKGTAIHFAQAVNEISQQLPLTIIQSEIVVVAETLETVQSRREFQIRPDFINNALRWLKENNKLYKDVEIKNRSIEDMNLENILVLTQPFVSVAQESNYIQKQNYEYLRGTISKAQSNQDFFTTYGGKQCTANCAAFIAYSFNQNLQSFSANTIDQILIDGDHFYTQIIQEATDLRKQEIERNSGFLNADDIAGDFVSPNLEIVTNLALFTDDAFRLHGLLKKGRNFKFNGQYINNDVSTLETAIDHFLTLDTESCILTTACYSMAICKQENFVFYFDSHSRTATGRVCRTNNGLAIILKFPLQTAAKQISDLVHINIQPNESINAINIPDAVAAEHYMQTYIQKFIFSIIPVLVTQNGNNIPQGEQDILLNRSLPQQHITVNEVPQHIDNIDPTSKQHHVDPPVNIPSRVSLFQTQDLGYGLPQHFETINPIQSEDNICNEIFNNDVNDLDTYFLHNIDYNEPEIENYVRNIKRGNSSNPMQLHRATAPPIQPYLEKHLEELSFVSLFPHGTHGYNDESRKIKQSPLKYFQARIMSSDTRFHTKEYLCYALDRIEQYKIEQQIGIVCNMKQQGRQNEESSVIPGAYNPHLYLKAIRGGASYWKQFGGDVFAMVNMLGIPTFWLTFSTDDLNSPELMNALWKSKYGKDSEFLYDTLQPPQKKQLLDDNPVLAARYFCTKVKQVISVLEKHGMLLFGRKVIHHIGRIEFQARGSGHYHMMIWCENTPDFKTEAGIAFINQNVSVSLECDIKDLVTRYQTHKHTHTCFKNNTTRVCRFDFPRKVSPTTTLLSKEETHRNHGRSVLYARKPTEVSINNYNPKLLQLIRSNMDIQVVGDVNDVIFYIAKYISKAEPEKLSTELQNALVTAKSSTAENIRRNLINVANVVTRYRQIGCPEVAFRVLGLPLRFSSKSFQFVPAYQKENRVRMIQKERLRENKTVICMNIIERYELRPDTDEMNQMCLFEFAAQFDPQNSTAFDDVDEEMEEDYDIIDANMRQKHSSIQLLNNKGVMIRRKNSKVIKYPTFNKQTQQEDYYYSLLLMFLPFRNEEDILAGHQTSTTAFFEKHLLLRTNNNTSVSRIGLQEELDRAVLRLREEMEHPRIAAAHIELEVTDMDVPEDNPLPPPNLVQIIDNKTSTFSAEQRQVYDLVRQQIQKDKISSSMPLRLFVSGEGGTGKSYVIQTLTMYIRNMLHGIGDSLQIAAPTACAAIPIAGMTLHRSFGIPVETGHSVPPYTKLSAKTLQSYRKRYKNLRWIILDEVSMISYETFEYINRRLQDIFESTYPFANINMLLFGDILQLKPCNGNWIYKHPAAMIASTDLWRLFSFVELKVNHRQSGTDHLKGICSRLRVGMATPQDLSHLMTRVLGNESTWSQDVKKQWDDVIRIFPTNKLADNFNEKYIENLRLKGVKIFTVNALDKFADGVDAGHQVPPQLIHSNINKTSGIPTQIQIGISVRIMLRCNLSLEDKLVNGSRGAIKGITWPRLLTDQSYNGQLPEFISVLFDDPTAGGYLKDKETNLVRIEPKLFDFAGKNGNKIHRMMLPCILVAGITCHKVQGQTVSRAVIKLKGWNIFKGGAYVALSRCTSLNGLAITEMDTSELLSTEKFCPAEKSSIEEYVRLAALPPHF